MKYFNINKKIEKNIKKHHLLNLFKENIDKNIQIQGRIQNNFRDFGKLLFFNIKNFYFNIQCISKYKEKNKEILKIKNQSIIELQGKLKKNKNIKKLSKNIKIFFTQIELQIENIQVIKYAEKDPNNFILDNLIEKASINRYLLIRNNKMLNILKTKTNIYTYTHIFFNKQNFLYIDTPYLSFDTPEGAKSFTIKDKTNIALSQSPQIYKELITLNADIDFPGYYQIARCFRNEDLRADRQYEFTQLDIELLTNNIEKIQKIIQKWLKFVILKTLNKQNILFLSLNYQESKKIFQNDKPNINNASNKITIIKKLNQTIYFKTDKKILFNHNFFNSIKKQFEIISLKNNIYKINYKNLHYFDKKYKEIINMYNNKLKFLWINNFPLFELDKENNLTYAHHPFVKPKNEIELINYFKKIKNLYKITKQQQKKLLNFQSEAFDLVFNGNEILSGSLRISNEFLQRTILNLLNKDEQKTIKNYNFFLNSFYFAPNEIGGCAVGIDRLTALLCKYQSIKSNLLFPRSKSGIDQLKKYE